MTAAQLALATSPTGLATVSVVVPCYRYGHFLPQCVTSVTSQVGVDVQVLIIDDASGDGSADVAMALAAQDDRVHVVVHAQNQGHLATYDEGFAWADGAFTVLLSADDLLVPGCLARATALMEQHPEVGFVYGRSVYFVDQLPPLRTGPGRPHVWDGHDWARKRFRQGCNVISSPEVVVRTALLREVGGFRAGLTHAGDLELWLRLAAHADVGYVRGADQALYRKHQTSMSRSTHGTHLADLRQRLGAFDALRDGQVPLPDLDRLHAAASRALAREALWRASRAYDRGRTSVVPVDELVAFAQQADPGATRLKEWHGLQLRRRLGPGLAPWLQPLLLTAVSHRLRSWWWWQSWRHRGG